MGHHFSGKKVSFRNPNSSYSTVTEDNRNIKSLSLGNEYLDHGCDTNQIPK